MSFELAHFLGGALVSFVGILLAVRVFPRVGLLDFPERYGLKRARLPYPGGFVLAVLAALFFAGFAEFWWIGLGVAVLGAVSFLDDRRPLPAWLRFLVHIAVAVMVFQLGVRITFVGNPLVPGTSFDLSDWFWLQLILTVGWIVVIQNAMNWFDGSPGLSVGVSGIGFLTLGIFGLVRQEVAWEANLEAFLAMSFAMAGICAGAWLLFWRGKILLGDTGSQVLGFVLAVLSIFAGTKIATTLLVLGLPILDAVFVVFRRVFIDKKAPWKGDFQHLHHNLAQRLPERSVALLLILISGGLGAIAVFLTGMEKVIAFALVAIGVLGLKVWAMGK